MKDDSTPIDIPSGIDQKAEALKKFWTSIGWRTLYCVLEVYQQKSISEMAQLAHMDIEETVFALEGLELLGFIKKTNSGYIQRVSNINRSSFDDSIKKEVLHDYLLPNMQVINKMLADPTDKYNRSKSLVYNSNKILFDELFNNIMNCIQEFKEKSEKDPNDWDGVYTLSAVLTKLSGDYK